MGSTVCLAFTKADKETQRVVAKNVKDFLGCHAGDLAVFCPVIL